MVYTGSRWPVALGLQIRRVQRTCASLRPRTIPTAFVHSAVDPRHANYARLATGALTSQLPLRPTIFPARPAVFTSDAFKTSRVMGYSQDGSVVAWTSSAGIKVVRSETAELVCMVPRPRTVALRFSPGNTQLATWENYAGACHYGLASPRAARSSLPQRLCLTSSSLFALFGIGCRCSTEG